MDYQIKTFKVAPNSLDEKNRTLKAVISTSEIDSDNEIVVQKGIKIEGDSVPLLWAHNMFSNDIAIGSVSNFEKTEEDTTATIKFAKSTQRANEVFDSFKEGVINSFSIGFRVIADSVKNGITYLDEILLKEVSAVNIPANRGAVAKNEQIGYIKSMEDIKSVLDEQGKQLKEIAESQEKILKLINDGKSDDDVKKSDDESDASDEKDTSAEVGDESSSDDSGDSDDNSTNDSGDSNDSDSDSDSVEKIYSKLSANQKST